MFSVSLGFVNKKATQLGYDKTEYLHSLTDCLFIELESSKYYVSGKLQAVHNEQDNLIFTLVMQIFLLNFTGIFGQHVVLTEVTNVIEQLLPLKLLQ